MLPESCLGRLTQQGGASTVELTGRRPRAQHATPCFLWNISRTPQRRHYILGRQRGRRRRRRRSSSRPLPAPAGLSACWQCEKQWKEKNNRAQHEEDASAQGLGISRRTGC
ncbi:hypothetical protein BDZ91DRAFT_745549 [Kalaharituber pfeilii]|nr:hypothetical protein BDZ91DRAFT_745549 [Kalaharituber pfeilii]